MAHRNLIFKIIVVLILSLLVRAPLTFAQEPALPSGLKKQQQEKKPSGPALPSGLGEKKASGGESSGPALPSGLGGSGTQQEEPGLPPGLGGGGKTLTEKSPGHEKTMKPWGLPEDLSGYGEFRAGVRIHNDPVQDDVSLAEARLQLSYDRYVPQYLPRGRLRVTGDLLFDAAISDRSDVDLEKGEGFIDLREAWVSLTPLDFIDVKAGRQILTWGTGNMIFLNDLFPKDYQSFFLGRDVDYLKAPSDALKASVYNAIANIDIVYTPRFDVDRFVDGSRLSFYDPAIGGLRGEDEPLDTDRPDDWFDDDEIAIRVYRGIGTYEVALYGYDGFWKSPAGADPATGERIFPELAVLGASLRGPVGPGIGNAEVAWYNSRDDEDGDDPFVQNSEWRFLAGYEQEVATDLTMGVQYYVEYMLDYNEYKNSLPEGFPARTEDRHWITLDLMQELMAQNQLVLSLFTFYDLSENDFYFRPKATYDFTDTWQAQLGGNIFLGNHDTFFGQFEDNSNVYASLRYSF